jgi:hypothetical protein
MQPQTLKLGNMIATPTANTTADQVAAATKAGWTPASIGINNGTSSGTATTSNDSGGANPIGNYAGSNSANSNQAEIDKLNAAVGNANPTPAEMDYVRQMFQGQIDAANAIYATERTKLIEEGKNRTGQTDVMSARYGLAGSPTGKALDDNQTKANNEVLAAADAEHLAKIAAITGNITDMAVKAAKNRYDAAKSGAESLIASIRETPTQRKAAIDAAIQDLINRGVDPDKVTPENLKAWADSMNKGNPRYQITPDEIVSSYQTAKRAFDEKQTKTKLETDKTAADIANTKATTAKTYADTKKILNDMNATNNPDTPLDPTSNSILAQTGLSVLAFNYLTQGTAALTRLSASDRKQVMNEAGTFLNKNGLDYSTFQSQYKSYNDVLGNNIKRMNNTKIMENEIDGTLTNLGTVASDKELGSLKWGNITKLWAGEQVNDPLAQKYAFHLQQLRNEMAGYFAASQGKTSPDVVDNADAEKAIKDGISKGTISALQEAVKASTEKMTGVMQNSVDSTNKAVWQLFGVGQNFKGSSKATTGTTVTAPDGAQIQIID